MFSSPCLTQIPLRATSGCRFFSAQQAQAALRPFYFAVHPDRARDPTMRSKNEKALQIFNGYLSDLFPSGGNPKPVNVVFSVMKDDNKLEDVSISLTGGNPHTIVETALRKLNLSTQNLPKPKQRLTDFYESMTASASEATPKSAKSEEQTLDELWERLHKNHTKTRKRKAAVYIKPNDLFAQVVKNREAAIQRMESHTKTTELLKDDIDFIKHKTGIKDILWKISWDQSYLRKCLSNVEQMINSATENKETILQAMKGYQLIFGRGSYICCDGSLQLGADDVPEKWEQVCLEAAVRRLEIKNFDQLCQHTRQLFGDHIDLHFESDENLLKAIQQIQSIIVKISAKSKGEIFEMQRYVKGMTLEIVSVYGELAVSRDGRLQIPSNVDFGAMVEFFKIQSEQALNGSCGHGSETAQVLAQEVANAKKALELTSLTFDGQLPDEDVIFCIQKLANVDESIRNMIRGLKLHISTNPAIYVMNDGQLSIPTDWV